MNSYENDTCFFRSDIESESTTLSHTPSFFQMLRKPASVRTSQSALYWVGLGRLGLETHGIIPRSRLGMTLVSIAKINLAVLLTSLFDAAEVYTQALLELPAVYLMETLCSRMLLLLQNLQPSIASRRNTAASSLYSAQASARSHASLTARPLLRHEPNLL